MGNSQYAAVVPAAEPGVRRRRKGANMSRKRIWVVGLCAVLACGVSAASFLAGRYASQTEKSSEDRCPGVSPVAENPRTTQGDTPSEALLCSLTPEQLASQPEQLLPG